MSQHKLSSGSLGRRLLLQLLCVAAILSALLFLAVRTVAYQAAQASHDNILGASAAAIAEQLGTDSSGIIVDIPYSAFSMLGAISDDRVFYRVEVGNATATGYEDLPLPNTLPSTSKPIYYTTMLRDTKVRVAAQSRTVPVNNKPVRVLTLVAQTRRGQDAITAKVSNIAASLGIGFFLVAGIMSWLTTRSTVKPLHSVANAIGRRGAHDLRPLQSPVPSELTPLITSLNDFIARLRGSLTRTETFMAEAAHHVRTPLATVRTQSEIALRQAETDASRKTLRAVIRAVDESSRSASQLLDHAMISNRSDQLSTEEFSYSALVKETVQTLSSTAELKDIDVTTDIDTDINIAGDRVLMEIALHNLLDNAIKYSSSDSKIHIELKTTHDGIVFRVLDEGRGLDGYEQSVLTQRFERGRNAKDVVGSGLGLTMVEAIAKTHNGTFVLQQNSGVGTCAILTL